MKENFDDIYGADDPAIRFGWFFDQVKQDALEVTSWINALIPGFTAGFQRGKWGSIGFRVDYREDRVKVIVWLLIAPRMRKQKTVKFSDCALGENIRDVLAGHVQKMAELAAAAYLWESHQ